MADLWLPPKPAIIRSADIGHNGGPRLDEATTPFCFFRPPSAAAGLTEWTRVGQNASTSSTVSVPSSPAAGDIFLYGARGFNSESTPAWSTPSGWTTLSNYLTNGNTRRHVIAARRSNGTESGTVAGMTAEVHSKVIVLLRPNVPIASIGAGTGVQQTNNAGSSVSFTVAASGGTPPLFVVALYSASNSITARGFDPAKDDEYGPNGNLWLAWKLYPTAPQNTDIDQANFVNNNLTACYSQITI